ARLPSRPCRRTSRFPLLDLLALRLWPCAAPVPAWQARPAADSVARQHGEANGGRGAPSEIGLTCGSPGAQSGGVNMPGRIEQRLAERGIVLPPPMRAMANYVPYAVTGAHVWIAGQGPFLDGRLHYNGKLGANLTVDDGRACARIVGLNILAQLKAACGGDLDRVVRCVKLGGVVDA